MARGALIVTAYHFYFALAWPVADMAPSLSLTSSLIRHIFMLDYLNFLQPAVGFLRAGFDKFTILTYVGMR